VIPLWRLEHFGAFWSIGAFEYFWSIGEVERWSVFRALERWRGGVLQRWRGGALEHWSSVGALVECFWRVRGEELEWTRQSSPSWTPLLRVEYESKIFRTQLDSKPCLSTQFFPYLLYVGQ